MGTGFFKGHASKFQPSGQNLEARAGAAGGYSANKFGQGAQKDIGAAIGMYKASKGLTPVPKTAATNAPGPKKV
jgi:hypothetical protein